MTRHAGDREVASFRHQNLLMSCQPILVALAVGATSMACGAEERPGSAPTSNDGGGTPRTVSGGMGSGDRDAGEDSAALDARSDASLPAGADGIDCPAAGTTNRAFLLRDGRPTGFSVVRAYVGWRTAPCDPATLLFGVSDGSCGPGTGTQLTFEIARSDVGTAVTPGINLIRAEPGELVRIRANLDGESTSFGTCAGATGTITFTTLGDRQGNRIAGTFDVGLPTCDAASLSFLSATGSFDVQLERDFEDVCP